MSASLKSGLPGNRDAFAAYICDENALDVLRPVVIELGIQLMFKGTVFDEIISQRHHDQDRQVLFVGDGLKSFSQNQRLVTPLNVVHPKNDRALRRGATQKPEQQSHAFIRRLKLNADRKISEAGLVFAVQKVTQRAQLKGILDSLTLQLFAHSVFELLSRQARRVQITVEHPR